MPFISLALPPKKTQNFPRHPIMEIGMDKKFNFYCHSMLGDKIIDSSLHKIFLPHHLFRKIISKKHQLSKESKIYLGRKGTRLENNPHKLGAILTLETARIFYQKNAATNLGF
jgi:hypothetical protein